MKVLFIAIIGFCAVTGTVMVGGWRDIAGDREDVQRMAVVVASNVSASSNSLYHLKVINVGHARVKVVAGVLYKMELEIAPTSCKKNTHAVVDVSQCEVLDCEPHQTCNVVVWEKKWLNFTEIQSMSCESGKKLC